MVPVFFVTCYTRICTDAIHSVLAPSRDGTLAAPIVKLENHVILFIVQNYIKIWFVIQIFGAITKSATLDAKLLS